MTEWKLVPKPVTDEMAEEGRNWHRKQYVYDEYDRHRFYRGIFYAMLAAAPEPPADERDAEIARLNDVVQIRAGHVTDLQQTVTNRDAEIAALRAENERMRAALSKVEEGDYWGAPEAREIARQALRGEGE
jgi:hypothetical protein